MALLVEVNAFGNGGLNSGGAAAAAAAVIAPAARTAARDAAKIGLRFIVWLAFLGRIAT
jgi:hypothetical protein